jgi:hypothetical protein
MRVDRYRALNLDGDKSTGICTQGIFAGVDGIKQYIVERGLDKGEALRVEKERDGKWIFVQNIVIPG